MTEDRRKDMMMGCLVGLAVGDAYGTTWEFLPRNKMPSIMPDSIVGGGPFRLNPGDWTDDTSMALCLAESLVEFGWAPHDQMYRYTKWWQQGYNSITGECFDIGHATRTALGWYNMTEGKEFSNDTQAAGNGVLMRLAAIPMILAGNSKSVIASCAEQSRMTHPSSQSIECSMIMGSIINNILSGEREKDRVVRFYLLDEEAKKEYQEQYDKYGCHHNGSIESIKNVEYINSDGSDMSGSGYCVDTLRSALWAFMTTDNFRDGLKKVVSLGEDTDTTGAVYGQIAGAYYGLSQIPWVNNITWIDKIKDLAEKLYEQNIEAE
jgi:ADP-ribosyl-[dinitrogen reductase] hydrolase